MSAPGFRSVFMVASCAGAALGCYLVSLRVASERSALEKVEQDTDRDCWMSADEAKAYGLVSRVIRSLRDIQ